MKRFVAIAILAVLVSACSRAEFTYRKADWLLEYYAWKAVRTSADQRDDWQPLLQTTLRHHREQELPLVIAYLDQAGRITGEADNTDGAACLVDGALLLYRRHARLAVDLAVPLLADLDTSQIRHLSEYTAQRQQEAIKHYLDPNPQRREVARQKRITERIENWTGKLNASQRQLIKEALEHIPDLSESWLAYRAQQTDTLLAMLQSGASTPSLRAYLDDWWVHRGGTTAASRQQWQFAMHGFIELMDNLADTLTSRQSIKLENRLGDLREDLVAFLPSSPEPVGLQLVPACSASPD